MRPAPFWLVLLVLPPLVALVALPPFGQRMVILAGIYGLMGLGYQLVFGQLGALNLAQGALFGLGAYAAALTAPTSGRSPCPSAILAAAIPAALVAGPLLRLQSHYFALATLALASLVNLVAVHAESFTGGANGLAGFATALPRGPVLLVTVWVCLIAGVLLYAWLFEGTLGEKARLLREAPLLAATLGIDGAAWRFVAFVVGGALAGLAGACSAALSGVVSPEATGFSIMVLCLTLVVLGGSRHPMGAVVGAALAVGLPELLRDLQGAWLLAYAVATLAVVLWAPEGLAGLIDRLRGARPAPVAPPGLPTWCRRSPVRSAHLDGVANASAASRRWPTCRCGGARRDRRPDRPERLGQDDLAQRHQRPRARRRRTHLARRPAHRAIADARDRPRRHRPHLPGAGAGGRHKMADLARAVADGRPLPAARRAGGRRRRPRAAGACRRSAACATPVAAC